MLDGEPFRVLSGAMHYFRVPRASWDDRLYKLKAMGLNTVETYVAWNLHEPRPGEFHFEDNLGLAEYIRCAARQGLHVIVRPGPYICAEWELGGLPAWLLKDPGMRLRCSYPPYLKAVDRFFDALLAELAPLQVTRGGPILAMQVENEYGSYGNDSEYLRYLEDGLRARGIDVLLFTSDGPTDEMLQYGTLPHILKTANFGSKANEAFSKLRDYQPEGPLMCMEFWNGWFDHWGTEHHMRDAQDAAATLDEMLAAGASVNFYMFHGGTNFGFMNGANYMGEQYQPTTTSYDYDAPLNEAGDPTPKYFAYREVLGKYVELPELPLPTLTPKQAIGSIQLYESVGFFEGLPMLAEPQQAVTPEPMEFFDQNYGFILYRTTISGPRAEVPLILRDLHDRALVFANGALLGTLERSVPSPSLMLSVPAKGLTLDILVENMGRVNYGPDLLDRKGITGGVLLGQQYLYHWNVYPLPLEDLSTLPFQAQGALKGPAFYRATFEVSSQEDTFLALPGWSKGVCWLNGFNLGRYWQRGPQHTLYVPGSLLKSGTNELVIFELHEPGTCTVEFREQPHLA
nr:beta-galactosidase [Ktedonobacter sp. SOSP1-85]